MYPEWKKQGKNTRLKISERVQGKDQDQDQDQPCEDKERNGKCEARWKNGNQYEVCNWNIGKQKSQELRTRDVLHHVLNSVTK